MKQFFLKKGIMVRHYDTPLLKNFIRISVGRPMDTDSRHLCIGGMEMKIALICYPDVSINDLTAFLTPFE